MARRRFKITDEDASQLIKARVDVFGANQARRPFERQIIRNRAFFFGKHYAIEDPLTGVLRDAKLRQGDRRIMHKANLMQGDIIRSMLTVAAARGEFVVPPKQDNRDAEQAAWVSTKLFEHLSELVDMEELDLTACLTAAIDGTVIWKVNWNPGAGEKLRFYWADKTGKRARLEVDPETARSLEEAGEFDDYAQGDVDVSLMPIFQCWWDWKARDRGFRAPCRWAAQAQVVSRQWMEDRYPGRDLEGIRYGQGYDGALYYNEMISYLSSTPGGYPGLLDDEKTDQTLHVEYWEIPEASNGQLGRRIEWAGEMILANRDNDYRRTKHPLPFIRQNWITAPGRFWGLGLAENLIGSQALYNRSISTKAEFADTHGTPHSFIPEGWGVSLSNITRKSGGMHSYKPNGQVIQYGPTPQLPKEVSEVAAQARNEMAEVSSQQSIDNSKLPGQIRSASGLQVIQEERNKLLGLPARNFLLAKREVGRQMLSLGKAFYPAERVLHYIGEDKRYRVVQFMAADIDADLRVIIDPGKLLASPALTQSRISEMVDLGVLQPQMNPMDREDTLRAMEFRSADRLVTARLAEEENQAREIRDMVKDPMKYIRARGDMMSPEGAEMKEVRGYPINPFDDDDVHERVLIEFMRSEEFRNLNAQQQQVLFFHLQEHQGRKQKKMEEQIALQQALQGGPGQKGEASQPKRAQTA